MKAIGQRMVALRDTPGDHLFFIGLEFVRGTGMLSYPNQEGKYKSLDHPVSILFIFINYLYVYMIQFINKTHKC